ncbi:aggrecan core protein-like [Mya arenaria]|uniref:aggrecan core protein-like n=1 Tax=Mya arenaria TaxID=6604 RepID=UPI0022E09BAE|nr:aggrecan core protein-like [Mya arenaria]
MSNRAPFLWGLVLLIASVVRSDYECVCNYNVETAVQPDASTSGQALGYMYEFDCKALGHQSTVPDWLVIQFEHKYGFIHKDSNIELQTCPGNPPDSDQVHQTTAEITSTTTPQPTTPQPTTLLPTTSTTPETTTSITTTTSMTTTTQTTTTTTTPTPTTVTTTLPTPKPTPTTATTTHSPTTTTIPTSTPTTATTTSPPTTTTAPRLTTTPSTTPTTESTTAMTLSTASVAYAYNCSATHFNYAAHEHGTLFTVGRTCYEIVPVHHTWSYAESDCKQRGGHLAHISDSYHQTAVYDVVRQYHGDNVWIGLNDKNHEENFEWTSGDPVNYTNWMPGRKDIFFHAFEDCVSLSLGQYAGRWEDEECGNTYGYVCEFGDINMCPPKAVSLAHRYGTLLVQHDRSCYELLHNKVTWDHGEALCQQAGGHLAHINNAQEQNYIQSFMMAYNPTKAFWIGLHDRQTEGRFEWTAGDPVTYTNWIPGHTDNFVSHNLEDCVAFVPYKGGIWDDIPCGSQSFFGGDTGETHLSLCEYNIAASGGVLVGR